MAASDVQTFTYQARDRAGKIQTGTLEAASETVVAQKLKGMNLTPINIGSAGAGSKEISFLSRKKKVGLKDLSVFARQFATMVNSGLSLLRSLNILAGQTENPTLAEALTDVRNQVEQGVALSTAMSKHPDVFPPLMVNMCKAGEAGGFLDTVMLQIAHNYESEVKLRGKVKAALTYPVVVFFLAVIMCIIMLIFIVPVFAALFSSLGGELPAPTRILVAMSAGLKFALPAIIVAVILGRIWWRKNKHNPKVRDILDPIKLKMPVFGGLNQKIALSRFSRNFGTMLSSGVPILQSLDIVADTCGNVVLARAIRDVQASVRTGEQLSKPLEAHPVFPSMVVQMMAVGEDTGALDGMLLKISEFYDQEVEATTESLTALIEPLMIAFLGAVVGSMILALYMPIFKIFDMIN